MRFRVLVAAGVLLAGAPPAAHHWLSPSFDASRPFSMAGVVTKFVWANPHVALHLDVRDEKTGSATSWTMDMGSPASLARLGWSKATLKTGDAILVDGIPARDGARVGYPQAITLTATGRRLAAAPGARGEP